MEVQESQTTGSLRHEARVTVGITTRNRQQRVLECIASLRSCCKLIEEVVIFDDASNPALDIETLSRQGRAVGLNCRVVRSDENKGLIAARNLLAEDAKTEYLLTLDDDVIVLNKDGLESGIRVLDREKDVAVIAFPQTDRNGDLESGLFQPCHKEYACYVDRFFGYAHLLRRSAFLKVGGYREFLFYYGEEPDLSLRLYCAGHKVVFLPERSFAHLPEQSGRDPARIFRYNARNMCWCAFLNMPLPLAALAIWRYLAWHKKTLMASNIQDDAGRKWVRKEVLGRLPELWRQRQPGSWRAVLEWKSIQKHNPEYREPKCTTI